MSGDDGWLHLGRHGSALSESDRLGTGRGNCFVGPAPPVCQDNSYGEATRATATTMPGQHTVTRWEQPVGLGCRERGARGRPARGRRAEGRKGFFPLRIRRLRQSWYCDDSGVQTEGYTFSRKARITPFNTFSVSTTVGSSRDVFFNGRLQAEH